MWLGKPEIPRGEHLRPISSNQGRPRVSLWRRRGNPHEVRCGPVHLIGKGLFVGGSIDSHQTSRTQASSTLSLNPICRGDEAPRKGVPPAPLSCRTLRAGANHIPGQCLRVHRIPARKLAVSRTGLAVARHRPPAGRDGARRKPRRRSIYACEQQPGRRLRSRSLSISIRG